MTTWVVTGASGFVGGHVIRGLGANAVGLSRRDAEPWTVNHLRQCLAGANGVVHAASIVHSPKTQMDDYLRFNVEGTRAIVQAARDVGVKRFVFISSIKVYGEAPSGVMNESTPLTPESPYARTKAEGERIVLDAVDLQPVVLRLCPVFGRGDKGNVRTMARAIRRRRFLVPGDGSTRKSLVHVSTVAEVVRAVCASSATGVFVVADREAASIRELADAIAASLRRRPAFSVPRSMLRRTASLVACAANAVGVHTAISEALIDKAMTSSVCDPSLAERTFGVSCHVDLAWAIRDEIDWLRTSGLL